MNSQLKRPYRKLYVPVGMDLWDPRPIRRPGNKAIEPDTIVKVVAHYGPFRLIKDEAGNEMSVGRGSLMPVPKGLDHAKGEADYKARLNRYWFQVVCYSDGSLAVMHQDDADAILARRPNLFVVIYTAEPFK